MQWLNLAGRWLRGILRAVGRLLVFASECLLGTLVFVILVLIFLASSQWAREQMLTEGLLAALAQTALTAELEGVASPDPGIWRFASLVLRHGEETLLVIEDAELRLPWAALLDQRLRIDMVSIGSVWLQADPVSWPDSPPNGTDPAEAQAEHGTGEGGQAREQHGTGWKDAKEDGGDPERGSDSEAETNIMGQVESPFPPPWLKDWSIELGALSARQFTIAHPVLPRPANARLEVSGLHLHELQGWPPRLELNHLDLRLDDQQRLTGQIHDNAILAELVLERFPLDLLALLIDDFNSGWLSAHLVLDGPLSSPRAHGSAATETRFLDLPLAATTHIEYGTEGLGFSSFQGSWAELRASGEGRVDLARQTLQIRVDEASTPLRFARHFGAELPASLDLDLKTRGVQVVGPFDGLRYRGLVHASGRYAALPLSAQASLAGGLEQIQWSAATLQGDSLRVQSQGTLYFDGRMNAQIDYTGLAPQVLQLARVDLPAAVAQDLRFLASGGVDLHGRLSNPQFTFSLDAAGSYREESARLQARIAGSPDVLRVETLDLRLQPVTVASPAAMKDKALPPAQSPRQPDVVHASTPLPVHAMAATAPLASGTGAGLLASGSPPATFSASGTVDLRKERVDLQVQAVKLPLRLIALGGAQMPEGLDGEVFLVGALVGPWSLPDVRVRGRFDGSLEGKSVGAELFGSYVKGALEVREGLLQVNGQRLVSLRGKLDQTTQALAVRIANLDLRHLRGFGLGPIRGILDADLLYEGGSEGHGVNGSIDYRTELERSADGGNEGALPLHLQVRIQSAGQTTTVATILSAADQQVADLAMRIPVEPYRAWLEARFDGHGDHQMPAQASLQGHARLDALHWLLEDGWHAFGGTLEFDADVQGTLPQPRVDGQMMLSQGFYENDQTGTGLQDVALRVRFQDQSVEISEGRAATSEGGRLTLLGSGTWSGARTIDLTLQAERAIVLERPDVEAATSGELRLTGDRSGYLLGGHLQLQPLTLNINSAYAGVPEIEVGVIEKAEEGAVGARQLSGSGEPTFPLDLDLYLSADQQAYLRGRGLATELKGEVRITGSARKPRFSGQFETIRGHVELFGKRFELVQGTAGFDGSNVILDLRAEHEGGEETFKVHLWGTLDDFKLELTSEPVLPQDEVLARLLFGKSIKNITPVQAVRLVAALQTLQGGNSLLPDPIEFARDLVGVDELNIESTETEEGQGVTVGVGKYLSEGVYLELKRTPDPNQPWQGRLDIELTPRLHLQTTTSGSAGEEGVELIWKKDY